MLNAYVMPTPLLPVTVFLEASVLTCRNCYKPWGSEESTSAPSPIRVFLDSIPQPNERNMAPVSKLTAQKNGHMGLFFNGDGSIIGAVSPHGKIIRTEWAAALILDEWLKSKGKDFEFYTEIFTPEAAFKFFKHYGLEVLPLYRLKEENRPLDKAVIWDSKGLRLGSFLPDWDGILQAMLLVQALCRHDLNWQGFLSHMDLLTQNRVQEHRSLSMDADHWAEKTQESGGNIRYAAFNRAGQGN